MSNFYLQMGMIKRLLCYGVLHIVIAQKVLAIIIMIIYQQNLRLGSQVQQKDKNSPDYQNV